MDIESTDYERWSADTLTAALEKDGSITTEMVTAFSEERVTGSQLKGLTIERIEEMGLKRGDWYTLFTFRDKLERNRASNQQSPLGNSKIFNDPIHGNIDLNPVCLAIIDTQQFQRLRHLKQLGLVYFVYPGAAHNRFEHSLGVCYLAGQFVRALRNNQPYLGITSQDILCVEIAALCHDIGHGPFSHLFDRTVIPSILPERKEWSHEDASKKMFDHLVKENGLDKKDGIFEKYGLTDIDLIFIKEIIAPEPRPETKEWTYKGRTQEKAYLYEIVANKRNAIDCDKWDYMARDCHQLGIKHNFDHMRFIKFARVNAVNEELQICLRDKELVNLYNMFSTRYTLHKIAYQHQVGNAMSLMVAHALVKANKHVLITGTDGKKCTIAECIDNMAAYTNLTDNIIFKILDTDSEEEDMKAAKSLIQRLLNRDIYKCVYASKPIDPKSLQIEEDEAVIKRRILEISKDKLSENDFDVEIVRFDFGMKDTNPVEKLSVYSKQDPGKARQFTKKETSIIVTSNYRELLVRAYSCVQRKNKSATEKEADDNKSKDILTACEKWFEKNVSDKQRT